LSFWAQTPFDRCHSYWISILLNVFRIFFNIFFEVKARLIPYVFLISTSVKTGGYSLLSITSSYLFSLFKKFKHKNWE
jgi:hypothetical protein